MSTSNLGRQRNLHRVEGRLHSIHHLKDEAGQLIRNRKFLSFDSRRTRCSGPLLSPRASTDASIGLSNRQEPVAGEIAPAQQPRTPIPGPTATATSTPRTGGCSRDRTHETAERTAELGVPDHPPKPPQNAGGLLHSHK